ncbi:MAG TPA: hypothetical protein VMP01_18470 [Pirellulaceae bacterium]|nr:hypothetical protein [Pirellulaceae bacterium]
MADMAPARRPRFQFGLRGLLIFVTLLAVATAWIAYLNRQAQNRTRLTAELVRSGILVDLEEPNWLGQLAKKFVPKREPWLRERLGRGWLGYPTVFCAWELKEEQVPETADRLKRLGTVREFHFRREPPEAVATAMRRELPDMDVLTTTSAIRTYYQRRVSQPVFAFEGAGFLALLVLGLIGTAGLIVWKWRRA